MKTKSKRRARASQKIQPPSPDYLRIPAKDLQIVQSKGTGLLNYWLNCWQADPYGSRWILTGDDTKNRTQRDYRKQLTEMGLFIFELRGSKSSRQQVWCLNLHGSGDGFGSQFIITASVCRHWAIAFMITARPIGDRWGIVTTSKSIFASRNSANC